jgi:hypothetical protein
MFHEGDMVQIYPQFEGLWNYAGSALSSILTWTI